MKITVVCIRVNGKDQYNEAIVRWSKSYIRFKPRIDHELVCVNRYADNPDALLDALVTRYVRYDGGGWDVGTWQFVAKTFYTDLLVCCNTNTYFWKSGWLERFVEAVEQNGQGLYGPMASNEVNPHIRTPCMVFQPEVIAGYPHEVQTREDTYRFESMGWPDGTPNVTQWVRRSMGYKTMLVTWDGCYGPEDWRMPANIFRRGDQSNCIVKDHHCDYYTNAGEVDKRQLEMLANGRAVM